MFTCIMKLHISTLNTYNVLYSQQDADRYLLYRHRDIGPLKSYQRESSSYQEVQKANLMNKMMCMIQLKSVENIFCFLDRSGLQ